MRIREHGYSPGQHLAQCDECGKTFLRKNMSIRWDKALVCLKDMERDHPQKYVRGRSEKITVPIARPDTRE